MTKRLPYIKIVFARENGHRSEGTITGEKVTPAMLEAAEDLITTLDTGERPPLKGLYDTLALAFGTTREDAKKRFTGACYGKRGKPITAVRDVLTPLTSSPKSVLTPAEVEVALATGAKERAAAEKRTPMTRWFDPTKEQEQLWAEWLAERPDNIRRVAERFDPWTMYRLTTTGQRARFLGCDTGVTNCGETRCSTETCRLLEGHKGDHDPIGRVTVRIHAEHPTLGEITARGVFGIDPEDLVPWTEEDEMRTGVS
jgi:hypothetical protein